jgi:hypothetical protein
MYSCNGELDDGETYSPSTITARTGTGAGALIGRSGTSTTRRYTLYTPYTSYTQALRRGCLAAVMGNPYLWRLLAPRRVSDGYDTACFGDALAGKTIPANSSDRKLVARRSYCR